MVVHSLFDRFLGYGVSVWLIVACLASTACADPGRKARRPSSVPTTVANNCPADYYSDADGLYGQQLKTVLRNICRQHEVFAYGSLWYYYELTDVVPGTRNQMFDYYSPEVYHFTGLGTAPNGTNKEHACPQSWWGKGARCGAYTDLFNVMPSDEEANSSKSNYPLGVVNGNPTYRNSHMKVGPSARKEYRGRVFEPSDEYKGDFARIYFYVATTYPDAPWGCKESVARTVAFTHEDYPTIKPWLIDLLLEWNAADPVSEWEQLRNERVFSQQHNRNPFIDYPELAEHIWGQAKKQPFRLPSSHK